MSLEKNNEVNMQKALYSLKSQEKTVSIPKNTYQDICNFFSQLTGLDEDKTNNFFKGISPDAAMLRMDALNMNSSQVMATVCMTANTEVGQDIVWLALCRAKMEWDSKKLVNNHYNKYKPMEKLTGIIGELEPSVQEVYYSEKLSELTGIIDELKPSVQEVYYSEIVPLARMGRNPNDIDLGLEIETNKQAIGNQAENDLYEIV